MFKSAFSKYLAAFILIILVSFLMLSGIITSMIKTYATEDKENSLISTSEAISMHITDAEVEAIENYALLPMVITPIINLDLELNILVADEEFKIILTTLNDSNNGENGRRPSINKENGFGVLDISSFSKKNADTEDEYYIHYGNLGGMLKDSHIVCAKKIITGGEVRGYVLSLSSTANEDNLISTTRRAVITSSVWVMFAAVIAVYFITERIIHPLRTMTTASKKFAKGDFETRVTVYGEDEVAELGRAFNNMAESLQNLEKMRNSFLASVSHDLRTPMTTISGFIDGITSGAIPPEKHDYYLGIISAEVHRLSRLVSQLLDVSRLESGDRKFNFTDFDVAEVARIILISFEQKIESKKLDVEFDAEEDKMIAYADKDAIYQVVYNLCHNAIKFSRDGGKFAIKIFRVGNGKMEISVFDEGQIIPKEDINMIFERFYKIDKSRGLDKSGVGLGLYICKTIIDAHGENIYAESKDGVGTEFRFTLKEGEFQKRK